MNWGRYFKIMLNPFAIYENSLLLDSLIHEYYYVTFLGSFVHSRVRFHHICMGNSLQQHQG